MQDFFYDRVAFDGDEFRSDAIEAIAYNRGDKQLYVEFQSGGEYVYDDVNESTYNLFVMADSLGHFWRDHISGNYTSHKDIYFLEENEGYDEEVNDASAATVSLSKYGVKWSHGVLILEAGYEATSEEEALRMFNADMVPALVALPNKEFKILAVTHYFE